MYGTGFFPTDRANIYALEADGLYLTGTSEVALASLHMGEILERADLPLRYTGFSTCFRREAGAAGKDTRGMFRVHQFNKVEMFVFVEPATSWDEHERMLDLEERFLQALGLPYRVMNVAAGDLGAPRPRSTSRPGSRRRRATGRSRRAPTRPTSRRAGSGSAGARRTASSRRTR
jgi:seryl-tRNA synthetase